MRSNSISPTSRVIPFPARTLRLHSWQAYSVCIVTNQFVLHFSCPHLQFSFPCKTAWLSFKVDLLACLSLMVFDPPPRTTTSALWCFARAETSRRIKGSSQPSTSTRILCYRSVRKVDSRTFHMLLNDLNCCDIN